MKKKDIIMLLVSGVIFTVAGILGFKQFAPKKSASTGVNVEVVTPIYRDYDQAALRALADPNTVRNFTPAVDLTNGLNNAKPFSSL